MDNRIIRPVITGIPTINTERGAEVRNNEKSTEFKDLFQRELNELKFSKHAINRIAERGMDVSESVKDKVSQAIDAASLKGIKDSLILFKEMAFVVNIDSRTVITAIDKDNMENKVFSNIDGAVFV